MGKNCSSFFWSDNWHIENGKAWFVDGERNVLFCLNLEKKECEYIKEIPDSDKNTFRLNPKCIKCENDIFCMPDLGSCIWVYHIEKSQFTSIAVDRPKDVRLSIRDFWKCEKKIFAVSIGLRQIIEINIEEKRIEHYYALSHAENDIMGRGIKVGKYLYITSMIWNRIYQFDLVTKETEIFTIPNVAGAFCSICFDGDKFWLSGYRREVYVWDKDKNEVKIIDQFPEQFGIYDFKDKENNRLDFKTLAYDVPAFIQSVATKTHVWFIPFQTNKILYIDKNTYEVKAFEMEMEDEKEGIPINREFLKAKYLLEYVNENRYIGLYSLKNNCVVAIDAREMKETRETYLLSRSCLMKMMQLHEKRGHIMREKNDMDERIYYAGIGDWSEYSRMGMEEKAGTQIYKKIVMEGKSC